MRIVSFDGEFFSYDRASISLKPANTNIPLWIGGGSKARLPHRSIGTGWLAGTDMPSHGHGRCRYSRGNGIRRSIDDDHYGATFSYRLVQWTTPLLSNRSRVTPRD